ncbi:MAG: PAS domain S-box protein, partial [bacterium]|nr:PAS domain S-box protein [bacterium]
MSSNTVLGRSRCEPLREACVEQRECRGLVAYFRSLVSVSAARPEDYRLLAENADDMIARHDEKGRVVFASRAAGVPLGVPVRKVLGDGLFEHVHVADRPVYLSALSRCANGTESVTGAFRLSRLGRSKTVRYAWMEMRC